MFSVVMIINLSPYSCSDSILQKICCRGWDTLNHIEFCCANIFLLLQHCSKIKTVSFWCIFEAFFLCCNAALLACNATYHIAGSKKILKVVPEFWYILSELYYTLFSNGCCNPTKHGAIIQTGTKCKKNCCFMQDSTFRWSVVENGKNVLKFMYNIFEICRG